MKNFLLLLSIAFASTLIAQEPVFIDGSPAVNGESTSSNYSSAIVDVNQDGWEDIYIGSKNQPNKLFINNGDGTFTNLAAEYGLDYAGNTYTAVWADFDNDGDPDCFLGNFNEPNALFENLGNGIFVNVAEELGIAGNGKTRCATTADVNQDGYLDIYVINLTEHNEFYLSDGAGGYIDHYFPSGAIDSLIGMGAAFFDSDNDGDQDLYLLHDAYQINKLFINDGDGNFVNNAFSLGAAHGGEGMGVDITDFNHDGWMDIYITNNYDGNVLLINDGDGSYTDISEEAGVVDNGMGWGVAFTDYNHDGHKDLYMANNYAFSTFPNVLYSNQGDSTFQQVGQGTILDSPSAGAGIAVGDLDLNGTEDIVVANTLGGTSVGIELFWNETIGNNWVAITLEGTISNRDAFGSRVKLYSENFTQTDELLSASGYSQMNSKKLNFGLEQDAVVDSLVIRWPNGLVESYYDLDINQEHHFVEGAISLNTADGDLDGNLGLNIMDLLALLQEFGCTDLDCLSDLTGDGNVTTADLLYLLALYDLL
ncbi:MAG: CRTAC1 family protein [Flavobacteriales bacterium]|nr:CRTAC1 family protein [Flavobacteriales bacterium]MDG1780718.1 CRTAC1 family protein [Flavobacteriales bacterium]MDG2247286.1 CRTAC1 family protein [Flavobacteriales bacterium]